MKFLYNPEDGAPIKKLWFENVQYFKDDTFYPDSVVQVEDRVGDFVIRIYDFVKEINKDEAQKLSKRGHEEFKCERCGKVFKNKIGMIGHMRSHQSEPDYIEGVKKISGVAKEISKASTEEVRQRNWDDNDKSQGLEGEGLVEESSFKGSVMK